MSKPNLYTERYQFWFSTLKSIEDKRRIADMFLDLIKTTIGHELSRESYGVILEESGTLMNILGKVAIKETEENIDDICYMVAEGIGRGVIEFDEDIDYEQA
jgi:hypothetical protein